MLLAKTFQQPTGQPVFQGVTMPVKQLNQQQVQVKCQCWSLWDWLDSLLSDKANLVPAPMRCQCCSLPVQSARLFPVSLLPARRSCSQLQFAGTAAQQDPESEQFTYATSPVHPIDEEEELYQQLHQVQKYLEAVRGI